ncbi:MAG TPA: DUF397 domain-containing protein [Pseudonocardiaceae bacterium]|nr:DUF397 domain-containing protein [Pseudonocardiaceae bacterium]
MTLSVGAERIWRKSSHSGGGNDCVEIATVAVGAAVRDSKNPDGPQLSFGSAGWATFLGQARARLSSH